MKKKEESLEEIYDNFMKEKEEKQHIEKENMEEELKKGIFSDESFQEVEKIVKTKEKEELESNLKEGIFETENYKEVEKIIQEKENKEEKEESSKDKSIVIAIILILLLFLVAIILFFLFRNKEDKSKKNSSGQSSTVKELPYQEIMNKYGDKVTEQIELYYVSNQSLPEEIPEVEIEGYTITCEIKEIYNQKEIYLDECKINESENIYSYGEKKIVEDTNTNTNTNTTSNSNTMSNSNSTSNKPSNTNTNKPSNTNKPTNSNKPSNSNTNKPSNTNTNKPTNTNSNTSSNSNTNVTPIKHNLYDELAKNAKSDKNIDFTSDKGDGIYKTEKNVTTTTPIYYYRGSVDNNYVVFANMCWRIVRTTNTGGIKLIYNGDRTCTQRDNNLLIGRIQYSNGSKNQTNYQYSLIYPKVTNWYETKVRKYDSNLEKIEWCNDTTSTSHLRALAGNPSFEKCPGKVLKDKVGLLTVDEVVYAGSVLDRFQTKSKYSYLRIPQGVFKGDANDPEFTNVFYATMSQGDKSNQIAYVGSLGELGSIKVDLPDNKWGSFGIRPVISLKKDIQFTRGKGTQSNPYIIE